MKKAFTMIELIFVIVIIGILAAVAIPRMANTAIEARKNTIMAFLGTMNRTVGPIMWTNHLSDDSGSVLTVTNTELLDIYTQLPEGIINIDFSQCADSNASIGSKIADISNVALPNAEELFCIDGNSGTPPKFGFSANMDLTLQHN